jgi:hypothetical protein
MSDIGPPHLFGDEPALMQRVFGAGMRNYMEFGIGGSTLAAIRAGAEMVVSVESDPAWVETVCRHAEVAPLVARGAARIIHADIGPVGDWGYPKDASRLRHWHDYIAKPWLEWERRQVLPDVIYVDGRFRVACCYSIALAFAGRTDVPSPSVLLHDMDVRRPGYRDVFLYFELAEQVGSLGLLRLRADVSRPAAMASLLARQFDPA